MGRAISAEAVRNLTFKKPAIGKRGYDEEEVNAFLDSIEDQLTARERSTGAAAETSTKTFREASDATNNPSDAAAAADAAWYEAKFGSARSSVTNPNTHASRGLGRFLRPGARGRRHE